MDRLSYPASNKNIYKKGKCDMPELSNEDILKTMEFPHNKWRKLDDKKQQLYRNQVLVFIDRLRKLQMPVDDIKTMITELYWGAFVEHELQVKESTGKKLEEFLLEKKKAALETIKDPAATEPKTT